MEANGLASADQAIENFQLGDDVLRTIIGDYTRELAKVGQ